MTKMTPSKCIAVSKAHDCGHLGTSLLPAGLLLIAPMDDDACAVLRKCTGTVEASAVCGSCDQNGLATAMRRNSPRQQHSRARQHNTAQVRGTTMQAIRQRRQQQEQVGRQQRPRDTTAVVARQRGVSLYGWGGSACLDSTAAHSSPLQTS